MERPDGHAVGLFRHHDSVRLGTGSLSCGLARVGSPRATAGAKVVLRNPVEKETSVTLDKCAKFVFRLFRREALDYVAGSWVEYFDESVFLRERIAQPCARRFLDRRFRFAFGGLVLRAVTMLVVTPERGRLLHLGCRFPRLSRGNGAELGPRGAGRADVLWLKHRSDPDWAPRITFHPFLPSIFLSIEVFATTIVSIFMLIRFYFLYILSCHIFYLALVWCGRSATYSIKQRRGCLGHLGRRISAGRCSEHIVNAWPQHWSAVRHIRYIATSRGWRSMTATISLIVLAWASGRRRQVSRYPRLVRLGFDFSITRTGDSAVWRKIEKATRSVPWSMA